MHHKRLKLLLPQIADELLEFLTIFAGLALKGLNRKNHYLQINSDT